MQKTEELKLSSKQLSKWIPLGLLLVFFQIFLNAQNVNTAFSANDIYFKSINLNEGLSQSTINDIISDRYGNVWIATQDGLNRFNGISFKTYFHTIKDSGSIAHNHIQKLALINDSVLLIATQAGVNIYQPFGDRFELLKLEGFTHNSFTAVENEYPFIWLASENIILRYNIKNGKKYIFNIPENTLIHCLSLDAHGNLWIGCENSGLYILKKNTSIPQRILSDLTVNHIMHHQGDTYVATNKGLRIFETKSFMLLNIPEKFQFLKNTFLTYIYPDSKNALWIGTDDRGLFHLQENKVDHYKHNPFVNYTINSNHINKIYRDKFGIYWIASDNGINYFDPYKQFFKRITHNPLDINSLSNPIIWSVFKKSDTLLIGTDKTLDIFVNNQKSASLTLPFEKLRKSIFCIADIKGVFHIGCEDGVYVLSPGKRSLLKSRTFYDIKNRVYCILPTGKGIIFGTRNGIFWYSYEQKKLFYHLLSENLQDKKPEIIRTIIPVDDTTFYAGSDQHGIFKITIQEKKLSDNPIAYSYAWEYGSDTFNLNNPTILSLYFDKDNRVLWAGTYGGGINKIYTDKNRVEYITSAEGLANNVIYGILKDDKNNIWVSTNRGISKIASNGTIQNFYESDGLQSNEFNTGAYFYDRMSNTLYFGGVSGVSFFNPDQIQINPFPPEILLDRILLFNKPIQWNNPVVEKIDSTVHLKFPSHLNVFSLELTTIHFSSPSKNIIQYRLEPFDLSWLQTGSHATITYTNLDPGTYHLKARAANSDNVWTDEKVIAIITILPPYWQTWWFRILAAIVLSGLAYVIYYIRVKNIEAQKAYLEKLVQKRTAEISLQKQKIEEQKKLLEEEKKKVENLLLNILPEETVEELKTKGKAAPRSYRMASVMFCDFKGFTQIAEKLRPKDLVAQLDAFFIKIDEIISKHNLEKIKTMGDAYMAAGGIPIRNKTNPIDITLAALEIQHYVKQVNEVKESKGEIPWLLRIGINTGELIAGVVGIKRFAYDVWGDTVNVAARMEMAGMEGKINVSENTYQYIKDYFVCEYRGKIPAKNKGLIAMYFVHRIKPQLSADELGVVPNEKFYKLVELNVYSKINYQKAEKHILKILNENLPKNLYYHSIDHVYDVVDAVERLAVMENVLDEDLFLLKTAALFHDAGFIEKYENNEAIGAAMAEEILQQFGYSSGQIEKIKSLIMATHLDHEPKNKLEEIIKDADLDYLGRDDFHHIADKLKKELMERNYIKSDKEWDELQVKFLKKHKYYTDSAIKLRQEKKLKHLNEIIERLSKNS